MYEVDNTYTAKPIIAAINAYIDSIATDKVVQNTRGNLDDFAIGEYVIIRTYSAGVWCGKLAKKAGNEVILKDARRMWQWWCAESISLSSVVKYGIRRDKSKICAAVDEVWLEAIEILPIRDPLVRDSIMEAPIVQAE